MEMSIYNEGASRLPCEYTYISNNNDVDSAKWTVNISQDDRIDVADSEFRRVEASLCLGWAASPSSRLPIAIGGLEFRRRR